jgi:hypothetical protein
MIAYEMVITFTFRVCVHYSGPTVWSSGQSSWLQVQRSGLDSRSYQIFWEVVVLERGPLSLVRSYLEEKVAAPV